MKMNENPDYPQIIEVLEEVPLPKKGRTAKRGENIVAKKHFSDLTSCDINGETVRYCPELAFPCRCGSFPPSKQP